MSVSFIEHHDAFRHVAGSNPTFELMCDASDSGLPLFHEACIYHASTKSIFVTSNQMSNDSSQPNDNTSHKHIKLFRIYDQGSQGEPKRYEEVTFRGSEGAMLNGGVNAGLSNPNELLFCAQGSKSDNDLSGIISVTIPNSEKGTYEVESIITSFYGKPFNSVNDVIVHPKDHSIWFTDPTYGHHQGIRLKPQLPSQVYRFDASTKTIRAVADGFTRPNGLCFSPDLQTLYVTDTGAIHGSSDVPFDPAGPSHIYAFDITNDKSGSPFLTNRRLFAYAAGHVPDGIKCDMEGNVYAGCGDGIEIWNPQGILLGVIAIEGGAANFCFGEKGTIYACNETKFWKVQLNSEKVRGALLGI